jgi:hypothetical protein
MPSIVFSENWEVAVLPPEKGVIVRFYIKDKITGNAASVILDCYGHHVIDNEPTWSICSYSQQRDESKCPMQNVESLLENIKHALQPLAEE